MVTEREMKRREMKGNERMKEVAIYHQGKLNEVYEADKICVKEKY